MPHFHLVTNVSKKNVPSDFLKTTSSLVAKILGKPESYVVVSIKCDTDMLWGGTNEPCGIVNLMSIGKLGKTENIKHSKALCEHIEKHLKISPNRIYITFKDEEAANVGHNGTTFYEIFGGK